MGAFEEVQLRTVNHRLTGGVLVDQGVDLDDLEAKSGSACRIRCRTTRTR